MIGLIAALSILCVGDSISFTVEGGRVAYCDQSVHETMTLAKPGVTAGYWLVHTAEVQAFAPGRTISLLIGTNETAYDIQPADFELALNALIDSWGDADEIILNVPPRRAGDQSTLVSVLGGLSVTIGTLNARLDLLTPRIEKVASERPEARLGVNWDEIGLIYPEDWEDQTHPNSRGSAKAAAVFDALFVPEPGTGFLLASGLVALTIVRQRTY